MPLKRRPHVQLRLGTCRQNAPHEIMSRRRFWRDIVVAFGLRGGNTRNGGGLKRGAVVCAGGASVNTVNDGRRPFLGVLAKPRSSSKWRERTRQGAGTTVLPEGPAQHAASNEPTNLKISSSATVVHPVALVTTITRHLSIAPVVLSIEVGLVCCRPKDAGDPFLRCAILLLLSPC
jgi:hypothetical protein